MAKNTRTITLSFFSSLVILSLIMMNVPLNFVWAEPVVVSVTHQPDVVLYGTEVTVEITFADDTNVTGIQIQYCTLEPDFICHIPKIPMTKQETNKWNGSFTVVEESGVIGYELFISHTNGSMIAPDSANYLGYNNIAEPSPGTFYFSIQLSTSTDTAPSGVGFLGLISSLGVIVIIRLLLLPIKRQR